MQARTRHRAAVCAASLVALAVAWAAACQWAAPRVLREVAADLVQDRMHRSASFGDIHVDPFRLRITVEDAQLPDAQGSPMLGWQRAELRIRPLRSLWLRAPVLADVRIEGLQLQATINARGQLNLEELALLAGPDDGKPAARWLIESLSLESKQAQFKRLDLPPGFALPLSRLALQLSDFGTAGAHQDALTLQANTKDGAQLALRGHLHLSTQQADAEVNLTALPIDLPARYLGDVLTFETQGGSLSMTARASFDGSGASLVYLAQLAQLTVTDASLRGRGDSTGILKIKSVTARNGRIDSSQREASLAQLSLEGLSVKAWRNGDGSLNLATLAGTQPSTQGGQAWRWSLPELTIADSDLSLEDRGIKPVPRVVLHDLGLHVTGLTQDLAKPIDVELAVSVGAGGSLVARGRAQPDPGSFTGRIEARDIDLRPLQPYIAQQADITLLSGRVGAALDVQASPTHLVVRGEAAAQDLRTVDNVLRQDFVQWKRLRASGLEFDSAPKPRLHVRQLDADSPYARVIVGSDRQLNLSQILHQSTPEPTARSSVLQPPLGVTIDLVRIQGGAANFSDLWIQPNFAVGILDLVGTVQGLSSQEGSRATVELKGAVDRYAPAVIRGEINPLSASLFSDLAMSFRNMDLTTVTPYSGRFAGYEIKKGKLSLDLDYHIQSRRLDAKHHVVLDQLELGDHIESPDATSLPIRLAIALLKDRNGVIDVQLPVSGSLDDPQFRVAPLVWRMLGNLVIKVATSPFTLLGNLFGGGDEVNQVVFVPGTVELDEPSRQRLESLRKAMVERPGLRLDVPAAWSAEVDRPALLQRQLAAQLAEVAPTAGPDRYQQLVAAWREEAGAQPLPATTAEGIEKALLERYAVGEEELEDLGRRRALAIQDLLFATRELDPVRVFVVDGKPAAADAQQLRVDLQLK